MLNDFTLTLDFIAALFTLLYIGKLLFKGEDVEINSILMAGLEKRSLLNQHVRPRQPQPAQILRFFLNLGELRVN